MAYKSAYLLIIEDHIIVRKAMVRMLQESGFSNIAEAGSVSEAVLFMQQTEQIDLALVDLNLPDSSGLATIDAIKKIDTGLPILLITGESEISVMKLAFNLGVLGFIPKTVSPQVMLAAIELVLSGGKFIPNEMLATLQKFHQESETNPITHSKPQSYNTEVKTRLAKLTPRQREVSEHLLMGRSNKEIARIMDISPGTVRIHISTILRTLEVKTRAKAFYFLNSKI